MFASDALGVAGVGALKSSKVYGVAHNQFVSAALNQLAYRKARANLDIDTLVHIVNLEQRCRLLVVVYMSCCIYACY